jgi:hypothetical protein
MMRCTDTNTTVSDHEVYVSVIKVNGEVMTPLMFRQLPKRRLMPDDVFQGVPWGKVNYFWGACHRDHLHIVWVDPEGILYRDCFYPKRYAAQLETDDLWKSTYQRLEALPQLYVDGRHEEGIVR